MNFQLLGSLILRCCCKIMAKEYYIKLFDLISELNLESDVEYRLVVKHFFSGAALYVNGIICASWSPVGLAFKLPENEANLLISGGRAKPLKYFPKGYVLFNEPKLINQNQLKDYSLKAAQLTNEYNT